MALGATLEAALLPARDGTGFGIPRKAHTEDEPAEEATELTDLQPPSSASTLSLFAGELILLASSGSVAGDQILASRSQLSAGATRGLRYS